MVPVLYNVKNPAQYSSAHYDKTFLFSALRNLSLASAFFLENKIRRMIIGIISRYCATIFVFLVVK
jgi:hypothetical protein